MHLKEEVIPNTELKIGELSKRGIHIPELANIHERLRELERLEKGPANTWVQRVRRGQCMIDDFRDCIKSALSKAQQ